MEAPVYVVLCTMLRKCHVYHGLKTSPFPQAKATLAWTLVNHYINQTYLNCGMIAIPLSPFQRLYRVSSQSCSLLLPRCASTLAVHLCISLPDFQSGFLTLAAVEQFDFCSLCFLDIFWSEHMISGINTGIKIRYQRHQSAKRMLKPFRSRLFEVALD